MAEADHNVKTFKLDLEQGREIASFESSAATRLRLLSRAANVHVSVLSLGPQGVLGMHPAASDQLLVIVQGSATVRLEGEQGHEVDIWSCVFWHEGESHETRAGSAGLAAFVFEGEDLKQTLHHLHGETDV